MIKNSLGAEKCLIRSVGCFVRNITGVGVIHKFIHCPQRAQFPGVSTGRMPLLPSLMTEEDTGVVEGAVRYYDRKKEVVCVFDA